MHVVRIDLCCVCLTGGLGCLYALINFNELTFVPLTITKNGPTRLSTGKHIRDKAQKNHRQPIAVARFPILTMEMRVVLSTNTT